jgi:hypothetical protein
MIRRWVGKQGVSRLAGMWDGLTPHSVVKASRLAGPCLWDTPTPRWDTSTSGFGAAGRYAP